MEILIVCTANICRSPMAETLLRQALTVRGVKVRVRSAGLLTEGEPAADPAVELLAERGLDLAKHRSRRLAVDLLRSADLVLTMERAHLREAVLLCPEAFPKIFTLKEIVRRGEVVGPRRRAESMRSWLYRTNEGRRPVDHLGSGRHDEVTDPIGRSRATYDRVVAELEDLIRRLVDLLWAEREVAPHAGRRATG